MEVVVRVVRVGRRCVSPRQHGEQAVNWPRPTPGRVRPGRHTPARAGNRLQPHGWVGGGRCRPPRRQQRAPLPGGATTRAAKKKRQTHHVLTWSRNFCSFLTSFFSSASFFSLTDARSGSWTWGGWRGGWRVCTGNVRARTIFCMAARDDAGFFRAERVERVRPAAVPTPPGWRGRHTRPCQRASLARWARRPAMLGRTPRTPPPIRLLAHLFPDAVKHFDALGHLLQRLVDLLLQLARRHGGGGRRR
jgi:hypothetical protein